MEGQREKTSSRRRQRRKAKSARGKVVVEPVLIAARRPDSPLLKSGFRTVVASAQPKSHAASSGSAPLSNGHAHAAFDAEGAGQLGLNGQLDGQQLNGQQLNGQLGLNGSASLFADDVAGKLESSLIGSNLSSTELSLGDLSGAGLSNGSAAGSVGGVRRRVAARIVSLADNVTAPSNREQVLIDRLVRSQGRGAISRAANDLWESQIAVPKRQEIQIQLLEHENETRARDAVFAMAELLQREAPIKRPVLDQRLRRLETSAEDPITRDAAGALRRSMRVHHGV